MPASETQDPPFPPQGPGFWGWVAILAGIVPFMVLWGQFWPLWVMALVFVLWGRRQVTVPYSFLLVLTLLSALPGLWHYLRERDSIGAFGLFLVLSSCVTLAGARRRQEHRVPFLLSFILLMASGHRTLEIFYLLPVFLFFLGYTLARVGETAEDGATLPRYRVAALLMAVTMLLSVPIFLFMPRTRMSVMALATRASLSGFGGSIRFGQMGEMQLSDRVVMRVETRSVAPLRGVTLDAYDRSGWRNTYKGARQLSGPNEALLEVQREAVAPGGLVDPSPERADLEGRPPVESERGVYTQDVILESFEQPVLFSSGRCLAIWAPGQSLAATTPGDVTRGSREARNEKLIYRVYSQPVPQPGPELEAVDEVKMRGGFERRYLQLPDNLPQRVRDRAREVLAGHDRLLDRCQAMVDYLQSNFTYSLSRSVDRGRDPVEDLLFGDPRGHCEYFASAMAVMLRCEGIHTRVVIGFSPGDYNPYSQMFTVRDRDAHAWVEVYFGNDLGWIPFDPTPADPSEAGGAGGSSDLFLFFSAGLDQVDAWWQNEVVNYYFNQGGPAVESWLYRLDDFLVQDVGLRWLRYPPDHPWQEAGKILGGLVALALLAWGLWREGGPRGLIRSLLEWIRNLLARLVPAVLREEGPGRRGGPGEAASLYRRWVEERTAADLPRPPSATPREYLERVEAEQPGEAERGRVLTEAYELEEFAGRAPAELLEEARRLLGEPGDR